MNSHTTRRHFLSSAAALSASVALSTPRHARAADLALTPELTEGPFYPTSFPTDIDNDLTRIAGQSARANGTVLDLSGRVLDARGAPVTNAKIEIWQCDQHGIYHHVGQDGARIDAQFQGYGATTTDADGRYRFTTIKPVPYPGRTPHIHYIVKPLKGRGITSQMFLEGEAQNERDFLFRSAKSASERERLLVKISGGAVLTGTLDIVVRG